MNDIRELIEELDIKNNLPHKETVAVLFELYNLANDKKVLRKIQTTTVLSLIIISISVCINK